jgi:hypothetical protein
MLSSDYFFYSLHIMTFVSIITFHLAGGFSERLLGEQEVNRSLLWVQTRGSAMGLPGYSTHDGWAARTGKIKLERCQMILFIGKIYRKNCLAKF